MSKAMTDEKQTGARAAAKEIIMLQQRWFSGEETPEPDEQEDAVLAIIKRHCPKDKGVGKLVEVLREIEVEAARAPDCDWMALSGMIVWIKNKVQVALADYEELKK